MNNATRKIYAKLNNKKVSEVAFTLNDETVDKIAAIVKQIIKMFQECQKTPEQATTVSVNPAASDKKMVKKAVKKQFGFFGNLFHGTRYYEAVVAAGKDMTVSDVKEVW